MAGALPASILVRHAHAEWPAYQGRDFDRPLTERGLREAQATGRAIRAAGHMPRRIIASPAQRTAQTAQILLQQLQLPPSHLEFIDSLYNADASTLRSALQAFAAGTAPVLLVAHNPGISELAQLLAGSQESKAFRPADWQAFGAVSADELVMQR